MTDHVEIQRRGSSLEIHLNRADKKNAVTGAMYAAMSAGIAEAEADPSVRSILFAGNGAGFCSGNDLQDFLSTPMTDKAPVLAFLAAISSGSKAMIAAVQGPCIGIGATLLLHCDHVVAAPSTTIQFNFVRIALVPEAGSSLLLPRLVGRLKAAELLLLGDPVLADEAHRLGLVSKVTGEGEQLSTARVFADRLNGLAPEALRATRRLLLSNSATVQDRIDEEVGVFGRQLRSPEFKEAVAAFMQKRAPNFG